MKTYVIWLKAGRKFFIEDKSFTSVMEKITNSRTNFHFDEKEINRIYCVDEDRSLVFFNNVSEVKKNA